VIPEDWIPEYIENFAVITTGSRNTQDRVENGEYPFFVRSQTVERINTYSFEGEAVLTAGDGVGTGKVFHYISGRFDVHQRVYRISDFSVDVNGYYFYLYFSTHFYNRIMQMTAKSSVDSVRRDMISRMQVALPPTEHEQKAIATAIRETDELLVGLDKLITKKRDLKQAAMQQLLTGKIRLPGFHGEWVVKPLSSVANLSKGTQLHSSEAVEGGRFAHLNGGISASGCTNKSNTVGNTIAISEGGNSCGFVQFMAEPYWCGGHCYSVIPTNIHNHFLYHALKGRQEAIMALRVGSGLPNVQKGSLLNFKLHLPEDPREQESIAMVLTDMDAELAVLEQRREKTRALKQGMLQELLTGRVRLV
jgi:type I restriction enzyme, S subunit